MWRAKQGNVPQSISCGDPTYPDRLISRLGENAPRSITFVGFPAPLSAPMVAFFCSKETPGATILKAFDRAAVWRDSRRCVISGFHSPLEKQCLDILLRGKQPVVMALARGMSALRLPTAQKKALDDGRLTISSPFPANEKRVTAALARERNRFVAALADELVFAHVSERGSLDALRNEARRWNVATTTLVDSK